MKQLLSIFIFLFSLNTWSIPSIFNKSAVSSQIADFSSDGCSSFLDGNPIKKTNDWVHCCMAHDYWYWVGGEKELRSQADYELDSCVAKASNGLLGKGMRLGVKIGGHPSLPTSWRWGYGREEVRRAESLNQSQLNSALLKILTVENETQEMILNYKLSNSQVQYLEEQILIFENDLKARLNKND